MYGGYNPYGGRTSQGAGWEASDGTAIMPLPAGAMGGAQRLAPFGSGDVSGRAAHNFERQLKVQAHAFQRSAHGYQNRKTLAEVGQFIMSHMEAGGSAYMWGQQVAQPMHDRYLNLLQRWVASSASQTTLAERCQSLTLTLAWEDMSWAEPTTGVSLKLILHESEVEYLCQNEHFLDAEPPAVLPASATAEQRTARKRALCSMARRQIAKNTRADATAPVSMPAYQWPALPALEEGGAGGSREAEQPPDVVPRQPRLVQQLPWEVEGSYQRTLEALQVQEAKWLADTGSVSVPLFADYVCEGFRGEFAVSTGEERRQLKEMRPQAGDSPVVYLTKLNAAWERAGGERVFPNMLLVETYMKGLMAGYASPVHDAVQQVVQVKFYNQYENINILKDLSPIAMAVYEGQPDVRLRREQVRSEARGSGQAGLGGRNQGGGQGLGGSRGVQQHSQPGRQRAAHAALTYGEETQYQAYAAQHAGPEPHSYHAVPPPAQHQLQYHQGGSSGGPCGTCGIIHRGVCYIEMPEQAHASWWGPQSPELYVKYVQNCAKAKPKQLQPVRYMYKLPGDLPKDVKDYLKRMGVREPERPQGPRGGQQRSAGRGHQRYAQQQAGQGGLGSGYMAQSSGQGGYYPGLEETFAHSTTLYEEEEAYSCLYVQSVEEHQPAEAFVSTTRASSKLAAAAERAAKRQQATKPNAHKGRGEGSSQAAPAQGSPTAGRGGQQPAADEAKGNSEPQAAAGASRPPLPAPVAARQLPARGPGAASGSNPAVAAVPAEPEERQAAAPRALPGGRPPPLPFTVNPIPAGTPPAMYPQPLPRFGKAAGTQQQVAVARGSIMQHLPVSASLQQLASQLSGDALKQLLVSGDVQLTLMQRSMAAGTIKSSDIAVNFSSITEVLRTAQGPQVFAAESLEGEVAKGAEMLQSTDAGSSQEAQRAAWEAAAAEQLQVSLQVAAMCAAEQSALHAAAEVAAVEEEAAAGDSTVCAAAAGVQQDSSLGAVGRPTAFQLPVQSAEAPGVTISLQQSDGGAQELQQLQRLILDTGADLALMGEDCARRNKVPIIPSGRRIRTSSGQVTDALSKVAAPVKYVLCKGEPGECVVYQETYVMPGSGAMYDFLLGTPLIHKWGMLVDPISSIATYRPHWHSKKDSHTLAHVPVLTAVDEPAQEAPAGSSHRAQAASSYDDQAQPAQDGGAVAAKVAAWEQTLGGAPDGQAAVAADAATSQPAAAEGSNTAVYEPPTSFMIMSV